MGACLVHNRISNVDHGNVSKADLAHHLAWFEYEKHLGDSSHRFSRLVGHDSQYSLYTDPRLVIRLPLGLIPSPGRVQDPTSPTVLADPWGRRRFVRADTEPKHYRHRIVR